MDPILKHRIQKRLCILRLLPLCHYIDMHDLLMLIDIIENKFYYELERKNEHARTTRQALRVEFSVKRNRLTKSDEKFFQRTMILYNYVLRELKRARTAKTTLTQIYWNFFNKRYSQTDKCTLKNLCRCGNCNTKVTVNRSIFWSKGQRLNLLIELQGSNGMRSNLIETSLLPKRHLNG